MNNQQRKQIVDICRELEIRAKDLARFYDTGAVGLATLNDTLPPIVLRVKELAEVSRAANINADRLYTAGSAPTSNP